MFLQLFEILKVLTFHLIIQHAESALNRDIERLLNVAVLKVLVFGLSQYQA